MPKQILWFNEISMQDVSKVGGKNASLGEMMTYLSQLDVRVPNGFATTADAYWDFLERNHLKEKIATELEELDANNVRHLAATGKKIRQWILEGAFSDAFVKEVSEAYQKLTEEASGTLSFAVRSSATAEDLPEASFAGQQETYLNISGIDALFKALKQVFASLYNDRAISYRVHHGFSHTDVAVSAGVQHMVRADKGASGVMFSIDTESGFKDVVFITASYGLGEPIVQGEVNPDEFYVFKPSLGKYKTAILRRSLGDKAIRMIYEDSDAENKVKTEAVPEALQSRFSITDAEAEELARYAVSIESHYGRPMDIEWAKDGIDGKLYILQARPETVKSRENLILEKYALKEQGQVIATGRSIGQKIGKGKAKILKSLDEIGHLERGDVLVTEMTDPDWEPIMKKASAIVTNRGGRTCHAAIVARELGIPAVVGTGNGTHVIQDETEITVSCAEGDMGYVYGGLLNYEVSQISLEEMPHIPVKIMLNVGNPERAFTFQFLPNHGVGLARIEFIISTTVGIHPQAILNYDHLEDADLKAEIGQQCQAYASPREYYIEKLKEGVATIAAAFYPKPVIVRLSDFKTNEYANLLGGKLYEPHEENPMLGFRGASRYISPEFQHCFELECEALKRVRKDLGLTNVELMIPFVRTVAEAKAVVDLLAENDLKRGEEDLRLIMMCEIPSNALLAEEFLEYFDGFSIGSNDLTQLTLGLDRDSEIVAKVFDERNAAVKSLLHMAIEACIKNKKYIGICGQGPSDHPDLAKWLVSEGMDSISLNPDSVIDTWLYLAKSLG